LSGGRGPVSRLLSSPRRRRRFRRGGVLLALAGVGVFVGLHYSNTGKRFPEHFSAEPVQKVPAPLVAADLSLVDRKSVQEIAARFIDTAVLRRHVDAAWRITTPKLRQGLSRHEWDTGNIPVTPFKAEAVREIKYRLDWSGENLVYLKVAIVPTSTSGLEGQAFDIGLARNGRVDDHKWLVDYWVPAGIGVPVSGPRAGAAEREAAQEPSSQISAVWIFLPLGLLVALVLGLPIMILGGERLRSRRALRKYLRERA